MANGNLLKTAVSKPALSKEPRAHESVNINGDSKAG